MLPRRRARRTALLVSVLAALVAPATPARGADATSPSLAEIEQAVRLRTDFGLASEAGVVERSFRDGNSYRSLEYGSPLTPAEASNVQSLLDVQARLVKVAELASRRSGYVGARMEGARLHVLVSSDARTMEDDLDPNLPSGSTLVVETTPHSRDALETVKSEIIQTVDFAAFRSVGISDESGRVRVGVSSIKDPGVQSLIARYGDLIEIYRESDGAAFVCNDCGTMGGVTAKAYFGTNLLTTCTTGFIVKWGSSSHKMLTAGHCIRDAGGLNKPDNKWRNGSATQLWSTSLAMNHCNGCNTDSGLFNLGSTVPSDRDQYWLATGPRDLVGTYLDSALVVGRLVCRNGHTSGYDCGNINARDVSIDADLGAGTFWVHHQWKARFQSTFGDSGSGMVTFNTGDDLFAAGILWGGTTASPYDTWFSSIQRVASYHGITVCVTNAC